MYEIFLDEALARGQRVLELFREEHNSCQALSGSQLKKAMVKYVADRGGISLTTGLVKSVSRSIDE